MLNKVDFLEHPERLFLNPWQSKDFSLTQPHEFLCRPATKGRITGFSASAHPAINQKIDALIKDTKERRAFMRVIEFNGVTALLNSVAFTSSHMQVGAQIMLSPAMTQTYIAENQTAVFDPVERLDACFARTRKQNADAEIPLEDRLVDARVPFVIDCESSAQSGFFLLNILAQLTLIEQVSFPGNIYLHATDSTGAQRDTVMAFVMALFPALSARVHFETQPRTYAQAQSVIDFSKTFFQMPESEKKPLVELMPAGALDSIANRDVLAMNSISRLMPALRRKALSMTRGRDFSYLPQRFFAGRSADQQQDRRLVGHDLLLEHLDLFGFEFVMIDDLHPLEQIALMAHAEVMVSSHAASFGSMLFANPKAWLIELGTVQTAQTRWGDFWPLAHVAGCHYVNFFADVNGDNLLAEPEFAKDGTVPVALSDAAVAKVMSFVVSLLGYRLSFGSIAPLKSVLEPLFEVGEAGTVLEMLQAHMPFVAQDTALTLLKEACHEALEKPKLELVAPDLAYG